MAEGSLAAIPPHVARYRAAPTSEAAQFDFLIGEWSVEGRRYDARGELQFPYRARWRAEPLHNGRMLMDDFTFLAPTGEEISAFVTLRTYSPLSGRWEIAGLAAREPGLNGQWNGRAVGDEMQLDAEVRLPDGGALRVRERFFDVEPKSFRWQNLESRDGGATWRVTSDLLARREP